MSQGLEFQPGATEYSTPGSNSASPFLGGVNAFTVSYWFYSKGPTNYAESIRSEGPSSAHFIIDHVATGGDDKLNFTIRTDPSGENLAGYNSSITNDTWTFFSVGTSDILAFDNDLSFLYKATLASPYPQAETRNTGGNWGTSTSIIEDPGYWSFNFRGTWSSNRLNSILGPVTYHGRALTVEEMAEVMQNPFACPDPHQRVWLPGTFGSTSFIPEFSPNHKNHIVSNLRASSTMTLARLPQGISVRNPFIPEPAKAEFLLRQRGWGKYRPEVIIAKVPTGTTFNRAVVVSATSTVTLVRYYTRQRVITVAATSSVALLRTISIPRTLLVAATSTMSVVRNVIRDRLIAIAATSTAALIGSVSKTRALLISGVSTLAVVYTLSSVRQVVVSAASTVTLLRERLVPRVIAIAASSTVALLGFVSQNRAVLVAATSTMAVARALSRARQVLVAGASTVTLLRTISIPRTIAVVGQSTVTLVRTLSGSLDRVIAIAAQSTVVLTATRSIPRAIVVAGQSTVALLWTLTSTFDRVITIAANSTVVLSRLRSVPRAVVIAATSTAVFTRLLESARQVAITGQSVVTATRNFVQDRLIAIAGSSTVALVGNVVTAGVRDIAIAATSAVTIVRKVTLPRIAQFFGLSYVRTETDFALRPVEISRAPWDEDLEGTVVSQEFTGRVESVANSGKLVL